MLSALLAEIHFSSAQDLLACGKTGAAIQLFRKAISSQPRWAGLHIQLGVAELKLGNLSRAEESFLRAQELEPRNPVTHLYLGILLLKKGELEEARRSLTTAESLEPGNLLVRNYIALIRIRSSMVREGLEMLRRDGICTSTAYVGDLMFTLERLHLPKKIEEWKAAWRHLRASARSLGLPGATDELSPALLSGVILTSLSSLPVPCARHLELGVRLAAKPRNRPLRVSGMKETSFDRAVVASWHTLRGTRMLDRGEFAGALAALRTAHLLDPASVQVNSLLGQALFCSKLYEEAEAHLLFTLEEQPNNADLHFYLGRIYYEAGRLEEARCSILRALYIFPKFPEALYTLGQIHVAGGEDAKAQYCFARAAASCESGFLWERIEEIEKAILAS